jgi:RimJ/RimL family protein N-acetyltransferase
MLEARVSQHVVDLGYVLAPRYWGQGLMPEAVRCLTEWALSQARFFRVQAFCDVENKASQRTLEKAGFVQEGRHERYVVHPNLSPAPRACYMYGRCR